MEDKLAPLALATKDLMFALRAESPDAMPTPQMNELNYKLQKAIKAWEQGDDVQIYETLNHLETVVQGKGEASKAILNAITWMRSDLPPAPGAQTASFVPTQRKAPPTFVPKRVQQAPPPSNKPRVSDAYLENRFKAKQKWRAGLVSGESPRKILWTHRSQASESPSQYEARRQREEAQQ